MSHSDQIEKTGAVAHKGMWVDPRMEGISEMPMGSKRMIMGGFEPILAYHKEPVARPVGLGSGLV